MRSYLIHALVYHVMYSSALAIAGQADLCCKYLFASLILKYKADEKLYNPQTNTRAENYQISV